MRKHGHSRASKDQASSRTKMELSMLNSDRKQTYVRENVTDVIGKVRRWNGPGQGTSTEYEITDGHRVSPPGHPTKGNYLEEARRDDGRAPSGRG